MQRPAVHISAGANGAGKTTFALEFLPKIADCHIFVNAGLIARGLAPLKVESMAAVAGRLFLQQIRAHIAAQRPFSFETTLSGLTYVPLFRVMRENGFSLRLYFLWIPSTNLALKRIAVRVRQGGHDIPSATVKRRYDRGLKNLFGRYLSLTDYCAIFDNAALCPRLVYEKGSASERVGDPETFTRILEGAGKTS